MESTTQEKFHQLSYYTLQHPSPYFIHQLVVDAFTAQTANANTKPIAIAFALVGLQLVVEENQTGRQAQLAHVALSNGRKEWPKIILPKFRGAITIDDVLASAEGASRDETIFRWCQTVWSAFQDSHQAIRNLNASIQQKKSLTKGKGNK